MDFTDLNTIKGVFSSHNLRPKDFLGQNFLVDKVVLDEIIKSADIKSDDVIVEIGPGLGVLTQELAMRAKLVLAFEKDYDLCEYLRKYFKNAKNVKIVHQDILTYDLQLVEGKYKLVSNLPYNITSPVIRKFLDAENKPDEMVLMVQKEVAERLIAGPGNSDRGILTVMVELFSSAEIISLVSRESFWPVPKVDSAVIKLKLNQKKLKIDTEALMKFIKFGFSQKRRQIHHPLAASLHLQSPEIKEILYRAKIDYNLRAEDLSIDDWIRLYKTFNASLKFD